MIGSNAKTLLAKVLGLGRRNEVMGDDAKYRTIYFSYFTNFFFCFA